MKLELTKQDLERFENDKRNNPIIRYLINQDSLRFSVGDILIRQTNRGSKWVTDTVSNVSNAPKKFMYVYENEFGVGYIRQLKADGDGFTSYWACLANNDPGYTRYVVDPDYADHMLINGHANDYSPADFFKQDKARRLEIMDANRKLLEPNETWADVNTWVDKLVIGNTFWMGHDIYSAVQKEYAFYGKAVNPCQASSYTRGVIGDGTSKDYRVITINEVGNTHRFTRGTDSLVRKKVFLKRPIPMKETM